MRKVSIETKIETQRIHWSSVAFWRNNKEACRYENQLARERSTKRQKERIENLNKFALLKKEEKNGKR